MRPSRWLLLLVLPLTAARADDGPSPAPAFEASWSFDGPAGAEGFVATATGEAAQRMPKPHPLDGHLYLLESWMRSSASVGFPAPAAVRARTLDVRWTMILNTGTEGYGFVWADVDAHGTEGAAPEVGAWEAPALAGSLGLGFDASDPPNRDPFGGSGNVYDRPQHELSIQWDGLEIVKRTTPMEFRDEAPHAVRARIVHLTGGAEVSVWIDDTPVFEDELVPGLLPYVGRPCFGARNAETAGDVLIDDLRVTGTEEVPAAEPPRTVVALDRVLNDKEHPRHEAEVAFPEDTDAYGRIVLTLRLDKPETRFDPWDRLAHVFAYADDGERFEILRYVTPYHRGHVWRVDVSAFRPLLKGTRRIEQVCGTQGEGWVVTVRFDLYPGPTDRLATRVVNLWSGAPVIGNPEKPVEDFYVPRHVEVGEGCDLAEVRTVVTGHGMSPNSGNAAEFMPIDRTLTVNGASWTNTLWKTDNYLNPCRPQGGTWKYDRAGWAPGDVVRPWVVDVSAQAASGALDLVYTLAPYVNENRGRTWEPFHQTEAVLVLYRRP